jgi:hypothetical protein
VQAGHPLRACIGKLSRPGAGSPAGVPRYFRWLVCLFNRRERKELMEKQDCFLRSLRSLRLIFYAFSHRK